MGEIIKFPKPDPDRNEARLIQEARAIYESVFPTEKSPVGCRRTRPQRPDSRGGGSAGFEAAGSRRWQMRRFRAGRYASHRPVGAAGMTCRSGSGPTEI